MYQLSKDKIITLNIYLKIVQKYLDWKRLKFYLKIFLNFQNFKKCPQIYEKLKTKPYF